MPQFVILRHTLPPNSDRRSHFDLMLECEGVLRTWAITHLPSHELQIAEELPPHRLAYLEYEGALSQNRGEVARVTRGSFEWLVREEDRIEVRIAEGEPQGTLQLQRSSGHRWTVNCAP
jgi:hypothetical protein